MGKPVRDNRSECSARAGFKEGSFLGERTSAPEQITSELPEAEHELGQGYCAASQNTISSISRIAMTAKAMSNGIQSTRR